jgi:hypothetical protein
VSSNNREPDFFLISGERTDPTVPTACWNEGWFSDGTGDGYMLVSIAPPIVGQKYGLGGEDIDQLILAPHLVGKSIFPVNERPCFVNVYRIKNGAILNSKLISKDDVELIGFGSLLLKEEDAADIAQRARTP